MAIRKARLIPSCDSEKDENCQPFVCGENEKDCGEVLCDEKTKEKDNKDQCNDPAQYNLDNPPVAEEETVCDPAMDLTC